MSWLQCILMNIHLDDTNPVSASEGCSKGLGIDLFQYDAIPEADNFQAKLT